VRMNKKLTVKSELSRILACSPENRARSVIDSPFTRHILECLSTQEAYLLIKEAWGNDSQILFELLPPETICHFIDMDCWDHDTFSTDNLIEWLWEIYNASTDTLQRAMDLLDIEIIVLLFQSYIEVVQVIPTDEHIPDLMQEGFESLDNIYFFRLIKNDEKEQLIKDLLSLTFTGNQNLYYAIMEGVMWESKTYMEENIYERRSLRLMELGFPRPDEAMSIYRHIKPDQLMNTGLQKDKTPIIDDKDHGLPTLYMDHMAMGKSLIMNAIEHAVPSTKKRFVYEMIYLTNKIIMADYKPINATDEIKSSMEKASAFSTIGLSILMRDKGINADTVLDTMNAETLFCLGYNMIVAQQNRLKALLKDIKADMIPPRHQDYVEGLLKKRPLYKNNEFSCIDELHDITSRMDRVEALKAIAAHFRWEDRLKGLKSTNTGPGIDLENIVLTSLIANITSKTNTFRPLSKDELICFIKDTTIMDNDDNRVLSPEFSRQLPAFLQGVEQGLTEKIILDISQDLTTRFEEEISGIKDPIMLDPRFITCAVVDMS